jgi:hypothetical protein
VAICLDPKDHNALYNLSALLTLRQEFDLAVEALDQALKHGFGNYDALRRDAERSTHESPAPGLYMVRCISPNTPMMIK